MIEPRINREVRLDYLGVRATYRVPRTYPIINLPIKHLGDYLGDPSLSDPTSDQFAQFTPTGTTELVNGHEFDVWSFTEAVS